MLSPRALVAVLSLLMIPASATAATPTGTLDQPLGNAGCVSNTGATDCVDGRVLAGVIGAALAPGGDAVLVASATDGAVAVLRIDPATGRLTQEASVAGCAAADGGSAGCRTVRHLQNASGVAVAGDQVYVGQPNGIAALTYTAGGSLTSGLAALPGASGCLSDNGSDPLGGAGACLNGRGLTGNVSIVASADGRHVYASARPAAPTDRGIVILRRDPATGALSQSSVAGEGCITKSSMASGDEAPAVGCAGQLHGFDDPQNLELSPDGRTLYVATFASVAVLRRNPDTGVLSQAAGKAGCIAGNDSYAANNECTDARALSFATQLSVAPDGKTLYVKSSGRPTVGVLDIAADGSLSQDAGLRGCVATGGVVDDGPQPCASAYGLEPGGSIAVSPDGASVLASGPAANGTVAVFDRAADGGLNQVPGRGCVSADATVEGQPCIKGRGTGLIGAVFSADAARAYLLGPSSVAYLRRSVAPSCQAPAPAFNDTLTPTTIAFTCGDANGDPLTLQVSSPATRGTTTVAGSAVDYKANPASVPATDSFEVRPSDGANLGAPVKADVTINPPLIQPTATPTASPSPKAPLPTLAGKTLKVKKGKVKLVLKCAAACSGKATLAFAKKERISRRKKAKVKLLSRAYAIRAGQRATLTIKLPKKARAALKRKKTIGLKLTLTALPAAGQAANRSTAKLKLRR